MEISWIQSIIYGFISGLTEFVPVSSQAHQMIMRSLFGMYEINYTLNLFVHLGMLTGLLFASGNYILRTYNEHRMSHSNRRRRRREVNLQAVFDFKVVKMAAIPVLLSFVVYASTMKWENSLPIVGGFLLLNGILLYIPMYLARGNKDSRNMSAFDSLLFGLGSALSALPGVSRIGAGCSTAIMRGADPQHAFNWSLMLSVPVLMLLLGFDVFAIFSINIGGGGFGFVFKCLLGGICAHLGTCLSVSLLRAMTERSGISVFSYYSFGIALFVFILYLY